MRNAESCQGVICGKSSAKRSANYPLSLFRILQVKNSAFLQIAAKLPFARIVQQMCNRCIEASGVQRCLPSVFFVVHLQQNRVVFFYNFLTSKSLQHSKCHIISVVRVIGFKLYNQCYSCRHDRTNEIYLTRAILSEPCRVTAAVTVAVATDRRDDRVM